jgi:hypothetical protein
MHDGHDFDFFFFDAEDDSVRKTEHSALTDIAFDNAILTTGRSVAEQRTDVGRMPGSAVWGHTAYNFRRPAHNTSFGGPFGLTQGRLRPPLQNDRDPSTVLGMTT